jgi:hypothetical protein
MMILVGAGFLTWLITLVLLLPLVYTWWKRTSSGIKWRERFKSWKNWWKAIFKKKENVAPAPVAPDSAHCEAANIAGHTGAKTGENRDSKAGSKTKGKAKAEEESIPSGATAPGSENSGDLRAKLSETLGKQVDEKDRETGRVKSDQAQHTKPETKARASMPTSGDGSGVGAVLTVGHTDEGGVEGPVEDDTATNETDHRPPCQTKSTEAKTASRTASETSIAKIHKSGNIRAVLSKLRRQKEVENSQV